MDANITAGPEHLLFMQWAQKRGVYVNGVIPARFDGHRIGLAAARNIQVQTATFAIAPCMKLSDIICSRMHEC